MSDNWVVQNLQNALDTWNAKITEIWSLVLTSPKDFKGGGIWTAIENVNSEQPNYRTLKHLLKNYGVWVIKLIPLF